MSVVPSVVPLAVGRAYLYGRALLTPTTFPEPDPTPTVTPAPCRALGGCMPGPDRDCIYCGEPM